MVTQCLFEQIPVAAYVVYRVLAHQLGALDARDFAILDAVFYATKPALPAPV